MDARGGARSVRSRLEAESERGLTPLVGRAHELALLQGSFADVQTGWRRLRPQARSHDSEARPSFKRHRGGRMPKKRTSSAALVEKG